MAELASLIGRIQIDSTQGEAQLTAFGAKVNGFASTMGTALAGAATAIAAGVGAAVAAGVSAASGFEDSMSKIAGLTDTSAESVGRLSEQVLALSRTSPQSAKELADGLFFVVSAGFQGDQAMQVLTTSAEAAAAGLGSTKVVADAVTSTLNAYKLSADQSSHVTDILANAVVQGKAAADSFAPALGRVLPIAAAAGVNFEQVAASMATMTRVGLNTEEAATALRGTLGALINPGTQAQKALAEIGLSAGDLKSEISDKGLLATLQDLMSRTGGNVDVLEKIIPNIRALTGVLATAGSQGETYNAILDSMNSASGRTDKAFEVASHNLSFQMGVLKNSLTEIGITVGSAILPALTPLIAAFAQQLPAAFASAKAALAPAIQTLTDSFGTIRQVFAGDWAPDPTVIDPFTEKVGELALIFRDQVIPAAQAFAGFMTGTFIPALITAGPTIAVIVGAFAAFSILTTIASTIAGVVSAVSALAATFAGAGTVIGGIVAVLGGPVTAAILAIVAVSALLAAAWVNNWGDIQGKTAAVAGAVLPVLEQIGAALQAFATAAIPVVTAAWGQLQVVIGAGMTAISGYIKAGMQLIRGDWSGAWQTLVDTAGSVFDQLAPVVGPVLDALSAALSAALDGISQFISDTLNGWADAIGTALGGIGAAIGGAFSAIGTTVHDTLSGITSTVGETFSGLGSTISGALDGIGQAIGEKWNGFTTTISGALDGIHQAVTTVWNLIPEDIRADLEKIGAALGEKFAAYVTDVGTRMGELATAVGTKWTEISDAAGLALSGLGTTISTAWTTIGTEAGTGWDAIKLAVSGKWDEITAALGAWLAPLGTTISTAWTTISGEATTGWQAISDAIAAVWAAVTDALGTWIAGLLTPLHTAWDTAASEATTGWEAFRSAVDGKLREALAAVTGFVSDVGQALSGFIAEAGRTAEQIGQGIVDGIAGAVRAGSDALGRIVGDVVRGMLGAARAALDSHSPSGEFAKIGADAIDGFINGVVAKTGAAREAIEAVVRAAIKNGMDPTILLALAQAESGLNPKAVGDQGHSVGLFQLHDQGQGAGMSVAQRQDPNINAETFAGLHAQLYQQLVSQGLSGADLATAFGGLAEGSARQFWDRYGAAFTQLAQQLGPQLAGVASTGLQPIAQASGQTGQAAAAALTPLQQFIAGLQPIAGVAASGSVSAGQLQASIVQLAASTGLSAGPLAAMNAGTLDSTAAFQQLMTQLGSVDPAFGGLATSMDAAGGSSNQATAQFLALATSTSQLSTGAQQATGTWGSFLSGMQPVLAQMAAGTTTAGNLQAQIVTLAANVGLATGPFTAMQAGTMDSTAAFEALVSQLAVTHPEFAAIIAEMDATGGSSNLATAQFGALVLALSGVGTGAAATSQAVTLLGQDMAPLVAQVQAGQISASTFEQALVSMAAASGAAVAPAQALAAGQISLNDAVKQVIDSVNVADPRYADLKAKLDAGTISSNDAATAFAQLVSSGLNPIPAPTGVATTAVDKLSGALATADKTAATAQTDISKSTTQMNTDTTTNFNAMFKVVTDQMTAILTKISDTLTAMLDATKLQTSTMVTTTQDNTKAMVTAVDTNGKAMVKATTDNTGQMATVTSDNSKAMVQAVGKAMTDSNTAVAGNKEPFQGALDTGYSGAVPTTTTMGINVNKELANVQKATLRPAQDIGKALVDGMIAGISQREGALYSKIEKVVQTAVDKAKAAAGISSPSEAFAREVGEPIADGVALGIERHTSQAVNAAKRMVQAVISASRPPADVVQGVAGIPTTGITTDIPTGIAGGTSTGVGGGTGIAAPVVTPPDTSGVQASIDAIAKMLNDLSIKVQGFTIDVKNMWLTLWKDLGGATIDGVTNVRDPIWKLLVPIATNWILPLSLSIMGLLKSAWTHAGEDASTFAAAFVAEMKAMVAGVTDQFTALQQTIGRMLEEVASTAGQQSRSIGQQIVSGVAQGMYDSASQIQNAAQSLVYAAQSAAQQAAQIRSPSKLMAETVGAPLGLGVAQGLLGTRGHIEAAMGDLLRPTTAYGPPTSNVGAYAGSGARQGTTVIYNVNVPAVGLDELATEIVRRIDRREKLGPRA